MRRFRPVTLFWLLELYALLLACVHLPAGVLTDEAKFLLSIPYPHPPLFRFLMQQTAWIGQHEFLWRFIIASLTVQAVWLIMDLAAVLPRPKRTYLCLAWLLSSAVILQAGTIVMAVLVALFGLLFVWFAIHPKPSTAMPLLACVWFAALFTAYQSILFLPLVLSAFLHSKQSRLSIILYICIPLLLLAVYSLSNPLAIATMAQVTGQDVSIPLLQRITRIGWVWLLGGSGILSVAGTTGVLTGKRLDLIATFILVFLFVALTSQHYYAILFTPVFIGGVFLVLCRRRLKPGSFLLMQIICTVAIIALEFPMMHSTVARETVRRLLRGDANLASILIDGPFGHEWQYESSVPVRRFTQTLSSEAEDRAQAFICTRNDGCDADVNPDKWTLVSDMQIPVWERR